MKRAAASVASLVHVISMVEASSGRARSCVGGRVRAIRAHRGLPAVHSQAATASSLLTWTCASEFAGCTERTDAVEIDRRKLDRVSRFRREPFDRVARRQCPDENQHCTRFRSGRVDGSRFDLVPRDRCGLVVLVLGGGPIAMYALEDPHRVYIVWTRPRAYHSMEILVSSVATMRGASGAHGTTRMHPCEQDQAANPPPAKHTAASTRADTREDHVVEADVHSRQAVLRRVSRSAFETTRNLRVWLTCLSAMRMSAPRCGFRTQNHKPRREDPRRKETENRAHVHPVEASRLRGATAARRERAACSPRRSRH
jgi:hypothetical protein